ncbi:MAG: efflux RND transporter periplasmic adaptor subunit [Gammaproteobacteria bacterium]|nr:efflux RND transporter periplasmic adaptor subunit [Gammaproteobacteria bacterium]MDH3576461.1 efflux RND transporter periplasmic adaptor subunit [Gammaproteobacteria bacterium]
MKKITFVIGAIITAVVLGILIGRSMSAKTGALTESTTGADREVLYWVAPMDPNYRRDEPGKSPMGMELVPVYADEIDGQPGVVAIDATIVNNLGVRLARAQRGGLSQRIETVGYVAYDEDTVQHVHTRVEGWIEKLATKASGDAVKKGQLLFELYSPTLVNAQEEYLIALRSANKLLSKASKERLSALGVTGSEIARLDKERTVRQRVRVYAESDGVIVHLGVREGIFVTPATEIMSVAKLDKVWVLAEVFERQAAWVKPGQTAMVELEYLPGEMWHGSVDYVYPELDPKTRTLKVRLRFDNAAETLRPNMFARVTIQGDSVGEVVHVPREALIRGGSVDRVVLALGEGRFRAQPVQVGIESGDRVAIRKGVSAGDLVVVSGQFLIDSESNIESALRRMQDTAEEGTDNSARDDPFEEPMDHSQHQMRAD